MMFWDLVPCPKDKIVIATKWVLRNKFDENDIITRSKARLVEKGIVRHKELTMRRLMLP